MSQNYQIIRGTVILVLGLLALGWFFWIWLKRSHDRWLLVAKWIVTALILAVLARFAAKMMGFGGYAEIGAVLGAWVAGVVLAVIWAPSIVESVAKKFEGLYTGGDVEVEARPYFSVFHALRSKGKYLEALAEIRKQLDKFPGNFEGLMLLAALQAEHLDDLPGAEITVRRFCNQPGHSPLNIAYALNQLADWHLAIAKDRDSAQRALEKITELLPETEMAVQAAQRIGRLADTEALLAPLNRQPVTVRKGLHNLGLSLDPTKLKPGEEDPEKLVADYVKHLETHPLDGHIRESLAVLYANHYQRLDLAADQLEQLIQQPHQPPKQVVKWLNLLADLQVRHGADPEWIRATLQRIIDDYPDVAAAENTRRRLDILNLEIKAKQAQGEGVKLGTYEQNIGLKSRRQSPAEKERPS